MPLYSMMCPDCERPAEIQCPIDLRHSQQCQECGETLEIVLTPLRFKVAGQVTPGGGADRFTADCLGIPMKELPDGLKQDFDTTTGKMRSPR